MSIPWSLAASARFYEAIIGPAPLDAHGKILDHANMAVQMRQAYVNAAFAAAGPIRKQAYGSEMPPVASTILTIRSSRYDPHDTILTTSRLALPTQLIEIRLVAQV